VGAFKPLSKLVIVMVMLRGRHRGLPVAIDRAVLLPDELAQNDSVPWRSPSIQEDDPYGMRGRPMGVNGVPMEKSPTMPEHHVNPLSNHDVSQANEKARLDTVPEIASPHAATNPANAKEKQSESEVSSTAGSATGH
jgi:hypothetical protein